MNEKFLIWAVESITGTKLPPGLAGPLLTAITILAIFVVVVFKTDHQKGLFGYFQAKNKSKVEQLEKYLANSALCDPECVRVVREIYDAEVFARCTGIYAEKGKRNELIWLHSQIGAHPNWKRIALIQENIDFDELGRIFIKPFGRLRRLYVKFLLVWTWFLFVLGQILWILAFYGGSYFASGAIFLATFPIWFYFLKSYWRQSVVMVSADSLKGRVRNITALEPVVLPNNQDVEFVEEAEAPSSNASVQGSRLPDELSTAN